MDGWTSRSINGCMALLITRSIDQSINQICLSYLNVGIGVGIIVDIDVGNVNIDIDVDVCIDVDVDIG